MITPKISIVTPSFNQGKYLEKTILSVLEQNYPDLEYIIIDGGSTDNSVEIIKKYENHLKYWVTEKDRGQSHAINKGFEKATGDIFAWLNSDDYYAPGALEAVAEVYRANPNIGAIVGAGQMVDSNGNVLLQASRREISLETLYDWIDQYFWQPSCFFTRRAWEKCGPLDESIHYALDLDLWIKIARTFVFVTIDQSLSFNLSHESAKTTKMVHESIVDSVMVVLRHGGEAPARKLMTTHLERLLCENRALPGLHGEIGGLMRAVEEKKQKIAFAENDRNQAVAQIKMLEATTQSLRQQIEEKEQYINSLLNSFSWKITRPLRAVCRFILGRK